MKKHLLIFSMIMLCIGFLPSRSLAQDAPGDGGDVLEIDGAIARSSISTPPSYVRSVKRNNGNATSLYGTAEARLQIAQNGLSSLCDIYLVDIAYLADPGKSLAKEIMGDVTLNRNEGYFSYSLSKNVIPAKKLMFYFRTASGSCFAIPETN